jgi:hypothetical protein
MRLYHVVSREIAVQVLADGFRDAAYPWGGFDELKGVCLTNVPLDARHGVSGRDRTLQRRVVFPRAAPPRRLLLSRRRPAVAQGRAEVGGCAIGSGEPPSPGRTPWAGGPRSSMCARARTLRFMCAEHLSVAVT